MTTFATIPRELEMDGVVHLLHFKTKSHAIFQNYTDRLASPDEPCGRVVQISGTNQFHVYRVVNYNPGEQLGELVGSYSDLQAAISFVEKEERIA
jgi:hypothetical protein